MVAARMKAQTPAGCRSALRSWLALLAVLVAKVQPGTLVDCQIGVEDFRLKAMSVVVERQAVHSPADCYRAAAAVARADAGANAPAPANGRAVIRVCHCMLLSIHPGFPG